MNDFFSSVAALLRDPVLHRVDLGWIAVITLDQLNAFVGLLVGIATLVYLYLRIRDQVARQREYGRSKRNGPESEDEGVTGRGCPMGAHGHNSAAATTRLAPKIEVAGSFSLPRFPHFKISAFPLFPPNFRFSAQFPPERTLRLDPAPIQ